MNNNFPPIVDESRLTYTLSTIAVLFALLFISSFAVPQKQEVTITEKIYDPYENVVLEAKSAAVFEISTGSFIFTKEELKPQPLASITKLMTALAASRAISDENAVVEISRSDLKAEGDSGLRPGEKFSLRKLIDFVLTSSSNDGAEALAAAATVKLQNNESFPENMNNLSKAIGIKSLLFENPSGLDGDSVNAGAYGTSADVVRLLAYITQTNPSLISATRYGSFVLESESKIKHNVKNTNDAFSEIPGLIGGKTGYTNLSGGNLAIVFDPGLGNPYVIVVLGSSEKGRFDDIKKLVSATLERDLHMLR